MTTPIKKFGQIMTTPIKTPIKKFGQIMTTPIKKLGDKLEDLIIDIFI
jgi:hypothetical protein